MENALKWVKNVMNSVVERFDTNSESIALLALLENNKVYTLTSRMSFDLQ